MESMSEMPTDIERIVDRKLIKQRVHYFVVWKGFGDENNTWYIELLPPRKKEEGGSSTPRGRSPRRSASKTPRKSKSPGRGPGRPRGRPRSRSRSASVSKRSPESSDVDEKNKENVTTTTSTTTTSQRRRTTSSKANNNNDDSSDVVKETPKRRSSRKQVTTATSTQFVSRMEEQKTEDPAEDDDDALLLRSTLAALTPQVREMTTTTSKVETDGNKKQVTLSYEEEEETVLLLATKAQKTENAEASEASATVTTVFEDGSEEREGGFADMAAKMLEGGWLVSFLSVAAVVGSLVASQLLPRNGEADASDLWRRWLPFLTPVVALLLFFHQKDARASAKWVATGLAWRAAAELLVLIGSTPREFELVAAGAAALANVSLLFSFVSIFRNSEHEQSAATAALLLVGVLALFLADR
ncbi:hypothetical protein BBJ28_00021556 [Nothophytophthora sp. Chile5]|nr:hypothetical protein BBJ28_00021556 [Nothophytophthora sp. Chile5]